MSRNVKDLHPRLQEAVKKLQKKFPMLGIGECFRTVQEQDGLYAQGRTKPGKIVTNARGTSYSSQHQWGIAVDFFYNVKGKEYSDSKWFKEVADYAKSIGLAWGGDWTSFKDTPHLYLPDWGSTTTKLKQEYGTPDKFMKTWNENKIVAIESDVKRETTIKVSEKKDTTYTGNSLVDYLNSIGVDSSFENRKKIAKNYGLDNYTGTANQNTLLLNKLRSVQSSASENTAKSTSNPKYYKSFNNVSIVNGLKSIGVDSSFANRKKIAKANGISAYFGTAKQNTKLCDLARKGKLKKA